MTVEPGESKTVSIDVSIPENQGAGSYYSAIVYSSGAPEGGNVGLSASGVTLAFVSIPGTVNEKLTLKEFGAYHDAEGQRSAGYNSFITSDEPTMMAYTLQNGGNVTESPVGSITLKNMFGQEISIDNVNPNGSLALIGQTRTFTACIKLQSEEVDFNGTRSEANNCVSPGLWPGMYTASLDLFYGQNGNKTQEITKTATFWYLPLWFIILVVIILLALAYFVWRIVDKIRNRRYGLRPSSRRITRRRR